MAIIIEERVPPLAAGDLGQVLRHLQDGLDSVEHQQFAAELSARRECRGG